MDITNITYSNSMYMTTNPPVSRGETYNLKREFYGAAVFTEKTFFNSDSYEVRYRVPEEKYGEIESLFETLDITGLIVKKLSQPVSPFVQQTMGASKSSRLEFTANEVTVSLNAEDEALFRLCERLKALNDECGEPIFDTRPETKATHTNDPVNGMAGFVGMAELNKMINQLPQKEPETDPPVDGEEWCCRICGRRGNQGMFCVNCGVSRQ